MQKILNISLLFILLSLFSVAARAVSDGMPAFQASLHSETAAIEAGKPLRLGVLLKAMQPGWHTYWENPGDAGLPMTLEWKLPPDFSASAIDWPPPSKFIEDPLAVYGYDSDVFFPVTVTLPESLDKKNYTLRVTANWLACKDICIPESAELELTLPAGAATPSTSAALFAEHDARRPQPIADAFSYAADDQRLTLLIPLSALPLDHVDNAMFFARESNIVKYAAEQTASVENGVLRLTVERSNTMPINNISGLISVDGKYFDIHLASDTPPLALMPPPPEPLPYSTLLLFALLGGLILNLMPCVLPVLAIKCLAVISHNEGKRSRTAMHGIAYTFGILVSFAALAALLLALRQGGEAIGWGFQMQSPAFVGFLIYLLFVIGMNLSGFFELPVLFGNVGGGHSFSIKNSFLTGVLATAVATPCTAPFMASAVGAALTLPAAQSFLIFEALGLGLALPFLIIGFFPAALKFLPKPGAWMERFKQALAFPMYASAIWLLWVLAQQTSADGVAVAALGMLLLALAVWIKKFHAWSALAITVIALAVTLPMLSRMEEARMAIPADCAVHDVDTVPYSPQALSDLRRRGTPVFLDATAAWCITCQVNARVAIHTERTMQAFKDKGITLMIADWTRKNPEISKLLADFGYQGVPLNIYFPPHGEPKILPQLLTEDVVIEALEK